MAKAKSAHPAKATKTSSKPRYADKVLEEFKQHFKAARIELAKARRLATADGTAYQAAQAFARKQQIPGAETLLAALLAVRTEKDREAALASVSTLATVLPETLHGHAFDVQGLLLSALKRYNEAIEYYERALAAPGYDTPGVALSNMGLAYDYKGDSDRAIECYEKALATPGYDTPGDALNSLGITYDKKENYERAIECYEKALTTPGYDRPGNALNNMGAAHAKKGGLNLAIEYYHKALAAPGYDTPGDALHNMGLAYVNKGDYTRAIECFEKALAAPGYDRLGDTLNSVGMAYYKKGNHERAIECYERALAAPGCDKPGIAFHNMGLAYVNKGDYTRAIECFEKALAAPGYEKPGNVLHNMGLAYANKGDYTRAIQCYEKALAAPGFASSGNALNNMGTAFGRKGDLNLALECCHKALTAPDYGTPHLTRNNIAITLRNLGRHAEALAEVDRVLAEPDKEGQHARARDIRNLILQSVAGVQATVAEEAVVKPEGGMAAEETPEQDMLLKLGRKDKYDEYLLRDVPEREDGFICLRGWSSAVTLMEGGAERQWSGGGYFLRWLSKGVVIDPGFDFIDNFHEAKLHLKEVDAVLVSHNHSDHNYDLNSIDDLRYELHRRWRVLAAEDQKRHDVSRYLLAIDEDTAEVFRDDNGAHRGFPVKFSEANSQRNIWLKRENDLPMTIEHFKVEHGTDVPHAMGLRLRLHDDKTKEDFVFGYTGDTRWHEALGTHLQGCDVLLAHISMPAGGELLDDADYKDRIGKTKEEGGFDDLPKDGFKPTHLGYRGMIELICAAKPKMVLVGEFWAGLADLRIDLVKGLRRQVKKRTGLDIPILPTGLGFRLRLPSLEVECTGCHKMVPHTRLKIAPAASSFGPLGYLCPKCLCE